VSLVADEKVSKPVRVKFKRGDGTKADFPAHKKEKESVRVDFKARNKKK